jgi:two-component system nitrate/nitrite response regulator NarL
MLLVLCDDQQILGDALAAALEAKSYHVVAVTTTAAAGVAAVAAHQPEVCLLDLYFPDDENGLDAAREICLHHPKTKVLLLSGVCDAQLLAEATQLGVAGFLSKAKDVDEIAAALDAIAAGGLVFDAGTIPVARRRQPPQPGNPLDALSPREKEILAGIVAGNSTQLMARAMGISSGTVRMHVRGVLTKLGAHSRLQAAAMARRHGYLDHLSTAHREEFTSAG